MVRNFMNPASSLPRGKLLVKNLSSGCAEVFYIPSRKRLVRLGVSSEKTGKHRAMLLSINNLDKVLTMFPIKTTSNYDSGFLKPKYEKIERITLAPTDKDLMNLVLGSAECITADDVSELLYYLPSGFTRDYDFGLGLEYQYRFIIKAVEELSDCAEVVISESCSTGMDDDKEVFFINQTDFEEARRTLDSRTDLGRTAIRSVNEVTAYNILAQRIGLPEKPVKTGRHPARKFITKVAQGEEPLHEGDQEELLNIVTCNTKPIAEAKPEKLAKFKNDIELVTLEVFIERYETMLGKKLRESAWQSFFNENFFILNLAFGYPIIKVGDQASVGGRKLSGTGDKIADFLVKNTLTNNTAIFEIKTPQTKLLNRKAFRSGVHTPSAELCGSINQVLDQKYQFQRHIVQIKDNSGINDIESYSVHCCLIIGSMPSGDNQDLLKSFELFRGNSKDVKIVTFDELLEKLKQLRDSIASQ